jgi:hypothetical protein
MSVETKVTVQQNQEWRLVGAAVTGTSHLKVQKPCHDAFGYKQLADGVVIMVVSDGAGSAAHAEVGSAVAVETTLMSLERQLAAAIPSDEARWQEGLHTSFQEARAAVEQAAQTDGEPVREYAATLVTLILADGWTVGALIGDSAAVALTETGELISLCPAQKGEYANMTNFLVMPDALDRLDIQARPETALKAAVFSDGLAELAMNIAENRPYPPFFTPLFAFVEHSEDAALSRAQLQEFLNSERINARTDDDKTLVLASRSKPAAAPQHEEPSPATEQNQEQELEQDDNAGDE